MTTSMTEQSNGNGNGNGASTSTRNGDKQEQQHPTQQNAPGMARLAICASGICVCYLYYGFLQERLFSDKQQRLGATFVLVTQCVTNTLVAVIWQQIERNLLLPPATPPGAGVSTTSSSSDASPFQLPLHHSLLLFTSACYCLAMTCSNEAIQYVSYPVAVLAKSCKLIPTMLVGQTVEGKLYSRKEWLAALAISAGILLFHWSRMEQQHHKHSNTNTDNKDDDDDRATYGMFLLLISLVMDGVLSSCQNFLKRPPATTITKPDSNSKSTPTPQPASVSYRTPNAVETMLYVNLYALLFLIPACMHTGQWQHGVDALLHSGLNINDSDGSASLVQKILILNAAAAAGQVFIFLTITWYTPVITTTITTTRKFVTILLSVWAFGHSFTITQWTAVALVFTGLYLVIAVQRQQHQQKSGAGSSSKAKTD
jgi:UDP-galactose transporter B1